jgi:2'-5' RNA ligase
MSAQLSLPGLDIEAPAADKLLLVISLDANTAERTLELARRERRENGLTGQPLLASRLHITLHHLGNYAGVPKDVVAKARKAAEAVKAAPFDILLNRVMSYAANRDKQPLVLCGGEVTALVAFQRSLGEELAKAGLGRWAKSSFTPHVTLLYDNKTVDEHAVEPIGWTVREFVLLHSLVGKTQHIPLGRWSLREQPEAENSDRIEGLRDAVRSGVAALDQGDFKEFADSEALVAYLGDLADRAVRSDHR